MQTFSCCVSMHNTSNTSKNNESQVRYSLPSEPVDFFVLGNEPLKESLGTTTECHSHVFYNHVILVM